jgi:nucleoid-associated protein YgaU
LWRIAESRLPGGASDLDVETLTRRLYALNRSTIGGDPDLIFPGMTLIAPEGKP